VSRTPKPDNKSPIIKQVKVPTYHGLLPEIPLYNGRDAATTNSGFMKIVSEFGETNAVVFP
jgi:hypothetical protein